MKLAELLEARQPSLEQRVRSAIREVEQELPDEAHYKEFDFDLHGKQVWYITQGSRDYEKVAEQIAEFFTMEGLADWTIHVISRDHWDGTYNKKRTSALANLSDDPEIQAKLKARSEKKRTSDKDWGIAKSWQAHEYDDDDELN